MTETVIEKLPIIYLARHGETAWSVSGQHAGLTDLPLTEGGARNARRLGERLRGFSATKVFSGPLQRDVCPPGGESPGRVGTRADRVVSRVREVRGDVLIFQADILSKCLPPAGSDSKRGCRETLPFEHGELECGRL